MQSFNPTNKTSWAALDQHSSLLWASFWFQISKSILNIGLRVLLGTTMRVEKMSLNDNLMWNIKSYFFFIPHSHSLWICASVNASQVLFNNHLNMGEFGTWPMNIIPSFCHTFTDYVTGKRKIEFDISEGNWPQQ